MRFYLEVRAVEYKPHDYQQRAKDYIVEHKAAGLFLEMGLGKTIITLTAVNELMYDRFEITRALVIAPLRVASTVWAEEAEKWTHTRHLRIAKVLGSRQQRTEALHRDADIYVINRENVPWLVEYLGGRWPFDMVVIDELSSFKSPQAARFKALRKVMPAVKRVVGLTGTPAPNGLIDLWSQIYLLDRGEALGKTLGGYRERYFTPGRRNGYTVFDWHLKQGAEKAIFRAIEPLCVSMRAQDYLTLPERSERLIWADMDVSAVRFYEKLKQEHAAMLAECEITAQNAAVVIGKLMQVANGAIYDDQHQAQRIHDAKLQCLEELIEAANGQPVVVCYTFKHDLQRLMEKFPEARTISTPDDVKAWNEGKIPVLLIHPASAGHGLNLQKGGHIMIWFGLTWSLEQYQQANARLHRQGQEMPVQIYHILTRGTVDERVMRILEQKEVGQDALIDAVRAELE